MARIFVTGTAGFIGFHLARRLLADGHQVHGYDGLTDYYDPRLKAARHAVLKREPGFAATEAMLEDAATLDAAADGFGPELIVHLAAQAGIRFSIEAPAPYVASNVVGTFHLMEVARRHRVRHLLAASTSSVYGANSVMPFRETDAADHPLNIYAATKKAGEAMLHAYAHLWGLPVTLFRFFTVYGPWGRPDMALFRFVEAMRKGEPIDLYDGGRMVRDFTFVDDLVEALVRLMAVPPVRGQPVGDFDSLSPAAPWRVVNIGAERPVSVNELVDAIEAALGVQAVRRELPMQPGEVPATHAATDLLAALTGWRAETPLAEGVQRFVSWFGEYYGA